MIGSTYAGFNHETKWTAPSQPICQTCDKVMLVSRTYPVHTTPADATDSNGHLVAVGRFGHGLIAAASHRRGQVVLSMMSISASCRVVAAGCDNRIWPALAHQPSRPIPAHPSPIALALLRYSLQISTWTLQMLYKNGRKIYYLPSVRQ